MKVFGKSSYTTPMNEGGAGGLPCYYISGGGGVRIKKSEPGGLKKDYLQRDFSRISTKIKTELCRAVYIIISTLFTKKE